MLFPFGVSCSITQSSEDLGDSQPNEQSLPAISMLPTIFLLSLLREPLLCKFLVLIFVPLPTEVQVLSLRREESALTSVIQFD